MNRFSSLEFDDADKSEKRQSRGEAVRDETYFYKQALKAWLGADYELALRNYSRALERNTSFFQAWSGQIMVLIEMREYPEAMVWADKALEMFPEHPELLAEKAITCCRNEKFDKAMAYSDNSISKDNVTPRVWLARAEVLLKRKSRLAEDCVCKALNIAGNTQNVFCLEAGRILSRGGKYSAALEYLGRAVRDFPKSALAWYELGRCQSKLGFQEAEVSLQEALHLRPMWSAALHELGKLRGRNPLTRIFRRMFGR